MNALTKTEAARPSLIAMMAAKHNMDPDQFARTVRATVMPAQHTNEQFAALMLVAQEYELNPIVKEIYAFPAKGGGIVPIVSIDGWINLVNSHPQSDGFEFEFEHAGDRLVACTCKMYRKDRTRPVVVTEYLAECKRNTEPWKMEHRMLRHKAMIQAARLAYGFSGVYDDDEGAKIAEMRDVTPSSPPSMRPPSLSKPAEEVETVDHAEIVEETGEDTDAVINAEPIDYGDYFERLQEAFNGLIKPEDIEEVWNDFDPEATFQNDEDSLKLALMIKERKLASVHPVNAG